MAGGSMSQKSITEKMKAHHESVFAKYGPTPKGLDWGERESDLFLRYDNMLAVLRARSELRRPRILDVGCGYGGLFDRIRDLGLAVDYSGIDICRSMIAEARKSHSDIDFECVDIFEVNTSNAYDYVVCNGIMTQKLNVSVRDMNEFVRSLIRKMYDLCAEGIAFNLMSNRVNFMVDNLFYTSPIEMLAWCMTELTPNVRFDHSYPLYEYTVYLYKNGLSR
jgi:2-polyprenyl-3-methyl-5-hydroxy-6-metoxy-1,4-benzoquinol methylase